jgi:plasmid replication initiation protein
MSKVKLDLITQAAFAALSLAEKNQYLQDMARRIGEARGDQHPSSLDRDTLSRLRRFYSRRRVSDLALDKTHDPGLRAALMRYSQAIHLGEVTKLLEHETPSQPTPLNREPPPDDAQLMFFVPTVHDAPLKDDVNLMDIAPFSLSKTIRHGVIRYELKDAIITIEGGAEVGLVTAYDYDIFIHMVTHLAVAMRDYRNAEGKGLRPSLPARTYRPSAAEILKFCRREQGGKQYEQLQPALDRLQATRYKITNLATSSSRRAAESFPLIGRYKVVSRTRQDKIAQVEIDIPEWVYNGVVSPKETPSILTLNSDYFLIAKPLAKFIYRLARKATGARGIAEYGLDTLHHRSGSTMPFRKFRESIEEIVDATKGDPLPDFDLEILQGKSGPKLRMVDRKKLIATKSAA